MAVIFIALLVALFMLGVPVVFSLGLSSIVLMFLNGGVIRFNTVVQQMFSGGSNFTMVAAPMFLLAGKIMNNGGVTDRLFNFAKQLVGFLPGGLGHVNVVASVIFAGMSGTAMSDAGGLGQIEIKAMTDDGFDLDFTCAVTAASSTVGPIIPPSIPMIFYAMAASVSVGSLFLAGVLPGFLMAGIMMAVVAVYAHINHYPKSPFPTFKTFFKALKGGILPLMTPAIILGGIYTGWFTPTESGAIAVVYSFVLSVYVYRTVSLKDFIPILRETVSQSATIAVIIATASLYGNVIIRAQIPQTVLGAFSTYIHTPAVALIAINVFLLIVGCFMEVTSAILILMPLFLPILAANNINLVHFGIIIVLNLMIGLLTPPFGLLLFIISRIGDISMERLIKALLPWIGALMAALAIVTFIPEVSLWLPRLVGMPGV